jgi:hypothetical protein
MAGSLDGSHELPRNRIGCGTGHHSLPHATSHTMNDKTLGGSLIHSTPLRKK